MKAALCITAAASLFLATLAAPLASRAADGLLIPEELNAIIPKIRPGMTVKEVEGLLTTAYPNVKSKPGSWSGDAGSMEYKLSDTLTLRIASRLKGDTFGKGGSNVLVHRDLYLVIVNNADKRRVTLQPVYFDKPAAAPTKGQKPRGEPQADKTAAVQ